MNEIKLTRSQSEHHRNCAYINHVNGLPSKFYGRKNIDCSDDFVHSVINGQHRTSDRRTKYAISSHYSRLIRHWPHCNCRSDWLYRMVCHRGHDLYCLLSECTKQWIARPVSIISSDRFDSQMPHFILASTFRAPKRKESVTNSHWMPVIKSKLKRADSVSDTNEMEWVNWIQN